MTQSHNANNDPKNHHQNDPARNGPDDEKPKGADGQPLDRSGSFEVAQNPDAFFQTTIPVPTERGPSQPTGYMRTEGEPGMSTSVPTGEPGMSQQQVMLSGHETPGFEPGMYNPAIMNDGPIPVYGAPEHQALVGGQPASPQQVQPQQVQPQQNLPAQQSVPHQSATQQGAAQQSNSAGFGSFFDEANRTAQPKAPIPTQPQAIPGSLQQEPPPSHSFNSFTNAAPQQPADGRRVPAGFFDPNETVAPATSSSGANGGTFHPGASTPYTGGMSAQQAFFFSGAEPPAPTQPTLPAQQNAGAFDSFTSSSSPAQTPQSAPQSTPPPSVPPQSHVQNPPHAPAPSSSSALSSSINLNAPMGAVHMDPSSLALPPQMESQEEGRELSAAELAQLHYDEYMAQLERDAAQPQPHFDPHEKAALEAANTERAAAEAIAQATALSGGLGLDAKPVEVDSLPETFLNLPAKRKPAPPPEPPRRPRKVIPPPEPFYDEEDEEEGGEERRSYNNDRSKRFEKLMTPETKGVVMFTVHQVREILTNAEQFFTKMPLHGNLAEPALFVFIVVCGSGLLAGIINFNLLVSIQFILGNLLQTFVLSFVVWKLCIGLGSREGFEPNFRVIAYSQAALVIAGLQFTFLGNHVPGYLTLAASLVMSIRMQLIGLQKVHDLKPPQLMLVVIVPTLVILLIRYHMFLMQRW